jgi:outer membrane protein assembly factor BamB
MDTDGAIYFGAGNLLYSIGDGGEYGMYTRWSTPFVAGDYIVASPAVSTLTGLVYFGADDGKVYAVDSLTGLQKWSITPTLTPTLTPPTPSPVILGIHPIYTAATIDVSGNVIIGNGSYMQGILYYLNGTTGAVIWSNAFQDVTGPFYNAVAVKDDRIYFSTIAYVYAVERTTGIKQWQYNGTFVYFTAPIVDLSGTIFVCGINTNEDNNAQLKYQSNLISLTDNLDTTFNLNWSKQITTQVGRLAPPVIGLNQTLYISGTDNYIYAVK